MAFPRTALDAQGWMKGIGADIGPPMGAVRKGVVELSREQEVAVW